MGENISEKGMSWARNEKQKVWWMVSGDNGDDGDELIRLWRSNESGRERWLTKWARKLIAEVRWCISKWAIC